MNEMEERKNLVLRFEFLRLIKRNKLNIREESQANEIRNYMRKHEMCQSAVFMSMCFFSFMNFRTLRSGLGTIKSIFYIYYISLLASLPMSYHFSYIMMDKYKHLASLYYDEVLSASKSFQRFTNEIESVKPKQNTFEISLNKQNKLPNTQKVEDRGLEKNRNEGFYEIHEENYDKFNYTEKDISVAKNTGEKGSDDRNDERFYGFGDNRNTAWDSGVNEGGTQGSAYVKPQQVRKIEFR